MRAVVQRVAAAAVTVDQAVIGSINRGLLVLLGIHREDTEDDALWVAQKLAALRIFEDAAGKMNLSVLELNAEGHSESSGVPAPTVLVVSQFTLIASTRKGNRPSFNDAARPEHAIPLYEFFVRQLASQLSRPVATGRFGAMMQVSLINDGPVTIVLDSRAKE
ncbi:MAG: D-aminoacyl-tRNA deacylase [Opitutus sp.]